MIPELQQVLIDCPEDKRNLFLDCFLHVCGRTPEEQKRYADNNPEQFCFGLQSQGLQEQGLYFDCWIFCQSNRWQKETNNEHIDTDDDIAHDKATEDFARWLDAKYLTS